jgi:DNA-binding NarL/FixJ family response regulator
MGARLSFASDGVEAYLAIRRHAVDLAIVSAGLARIDGITLVRTLVRSTSFGAWTLLLLGPDCHARVREALEARPSGILVRPFDAATFTDRLQTILGVERPAPRAPAPSRTPAS